MRDNQNQTRNQVTGTDLAPIAIFAYNRADRIEALLASLRSCPEFERSLVRIYSDGPKGSADKDAVKAVRAVLRDLPFGNVQLVFRETNFGLSNSLTNGISELCAEFGRVIVLEDDLDVSPCLLTYFNGALRTYKDCDQVFSICADAPKSTALNARNEAYFLPTASSWGWATWERAWSKFEKHQITSEISSTRAFRDRLSVHGLREYPKMLKMAEEGLIDSWFIFWQTTVVLYNGVCLYPPRSLARNTGFSAGTHGSRFNLFRFFNVELEENIGILDFRFPEIIQMDFVALNEVIRSPKWRILRLNSILGELRRRIIGAAVRLRKQKKLKDWK